jgi:hypothetical protein
VIEQSRTAATTQQIQHFQEISMRIATLTITGLLAFTGSVALAETPVQQVGQYNQDIHQLNKDIGANKTDRSHDEQVYDDHRYDLNRDRLDRNADRAREDRDLAKGDYKGAAYWNNQRKDENGKIATQKHDLSRTARNIRADNTRLAKDVQVRHRDVVKRNRAASKI